MLESKVKTILILGGYGNAGHCIAQHLVRETTTTATTIIIAGRDGDRAKQVALQLGLEYNCPNRIRWCRVDATDTNSLDEAFSMSKQQQQDDDDNDGIVAVAAIPAAAVNMVVVASSTTSCAKQVAEAALRHHVNYYFDIQLSSKSKIHDLTALEGQIRAANACFVTDGGVHPGVPGALVRYAAAQAMATANNEVNNTNDAGSTTTTTTTTMAAVHCANVYLIFRPNWKEYKFSPATQKEFIQEMCQMPPMLYRNGAWVETGWTCTPTFDFGLPFGKQMCMPMFLQEMKNIAEDNQQMMMMMMQEMGVYVSGFNWFTDYIVLSLVLLVFLIFPKRVAGWLDPLLAGLFQWSLITFSKPPYGGKIVMEAVMGSTKYQPQPQSQNDDDRKTRLRLELTHLDVYEATAIPAVATILQMLDYNIDDKLSSSSSSPPPGLHYQAQLVEPRRFLKDMQRLGMEIKEEIHKQ